MSLRCNPILLSGLFIMSILSGCVRETNKVCRQGLHISFHSQTECQSEPVYPSEITDIRLCIFDDNGVLAYTDLETGVGFDASYSRTVELAKGLYYVVAWSGLDESHFDISPLQVAVTTMSDLVFRIIRAGELARSIEGINVYYGESPGVYVEESSSESLFAHTTVNFLEVTNRIEISVEGLPEENEYEIYIESDNGSMTVSGKVAGDDVLRYEPTVLSPEDGIASEFTMLKLETGHTYTIVVRNLTDGTELYRGSLLGALILKNPFVNLRCDHDFKIRFTAEDQTGDGTYTIAEIWVNNWLVHSYGTDF